MRMNPVDWHHATSESLQRSLIPDHRTEVNSREVDSITSEEWQTFCKYARDTVGEAQSWMGGNVARKELPVPPHDFCVMDAEAEDTDGESLEVDEEDPELRRKRKELREIEEQIMFKRAAIALKTVEPLLKKTTSLDFSYNESTSCNVASLKDRVNLILQQHHPLRFLSTVRSSKERIKSSLIKNGPPRVDHPLKLRVKALMKRRSSDSFLPAREEAPDLTPSPPCRGNSSPDNEDVVHKGFQRFLSILNEGVDMDFLSRIVNDDSPDLPLGEELLNVQVPSVESMSDPTFRGAREQSDGEGSLPGSNRANGEEVECDKLTQERSLGERLSLPANDDEERSRSKSPSPVKKRKEEEGKPEVDEQRAQLQNVLQSLGLSLEVEEMSKLADRTRERLYGKKHEAKGPEQEIRHRGPQRHCSKSSSSSSSSSRSSSRSNGPSPARRQRSHSRETGQRSECGRRSNDRRGDGLTCLDGSEQRYDEKNTKEMFSYQQNHTYSQPAALSAFSQNSFYQSSQYTAYHNGSYSTASHSHWTSTQVAAPPFFYSSGCPYPQNTYQHSSAAEVPPQNTYQHSSAAEVPPVIYTPNRCKLLKRNRLRNAHVLLSEDHTGSVSGNLCLQVIGTKQPTGGSGLRKPPPPKKKKKKKKKKNVCAVVHANIHYAQSLDTNRFMNPNLSESEGQTGFFFSREPCLQTVGTKKPTAESCLQPLTKSQKKDAKKRRAYLRKLAAKQATVNTTKQPGEQRPPTKQPGEQRPRTEEEIKANLRKTLKAFNLKMKQKAPEPGYPLTSPTGDICGSS